MTDQHAERRRHRRAAGTFDLHITGPDASRRIRVRDISVSGVACHSDFAIPEMTRVHLDLFLPWTPAPGNAAGPVHCEGAVVRCQPLPQGPVPSFDMAIFFTKVAEAGRHRIAEYVESHPTGGGRSGATPFPPGR